MKKTLLGTALVLAFGATAMSAQAANTFVFKNGTGVTAGTLASSWFSMMTDVVRDSDGNPVLDANGNPTPIFTNTAIRGTNTTLTTGSLNMDVTNTITTSPSPQNGAHNTGNSIDRDWSFFQNWGAHFTMGALEVTYTTGTTASVNMSDWRVTWNGIPAINMGGGAAAVLSAGADGLWGTGNETLDYSAIVPQGDPSGFGGVPYGLHLYGTMATPVNTSVVPVPAAAWLLGSGLLGLVGVARRKAA